MQQSRARPANSTDILRGEKRRENIVCASDNGSHKKIQYHRPATSIGNSRRFAVLINNREGRYITKCCAGSEKKSFYIAKWRIDMPARRDAQRSTPTMQRVIARISTRGSARRDLLRSTRASSFHVHTSVGWRTASAAFITFHALHRATINYYGGPFKPSAATRRNYREPSSQ